MYVVPRRAKSAISKMAKSDVMTMHWVTKSPWALAMSRWLKRMRYKPTLKLQV
jgi:hypothetical protein